MRSEFMIERNGKNFCLYAGLLDEAHQQGLSEIRTSLVQIPTDANGNVAICQCEVRTEKGVFTGLGDAAPNNVARAMVTCLIRMAETRAKARALRDAVNVGVAAFEELDAEAGEQSEHGSSPRSAIRPTSISTSSDAPSAGPVRRSAGPGRVSSPAVADGPREYGPSRSQGSRQDEGSFGQTAREGGSDAITPAQRRMLEALARQAGEEVDVDRLSRQQASQRISELQSRLNQARAA